MEARWLLNGAVKLDANDIFSPDCTTAVVDAAVP